MDLIGRPVAPDGGVKLTGLAPQGVDLAHFAPLTVVLTCFVIGLPRHDAASDGLLHCVFT